MSVRTGGWWVLSTWMAGVTRYERIRRRDEGRCCKCGEDGAEIDHIIPRALGGWDDDDNLQLICRECHAIKTREDRRAIARARRKGRSKPPVVRSRWRRLVGGGVVDRAADDRSRRR